MTGTPRPLEVIILAAGQGTRMRSARPKVLHELAGQALLRHVYAAAAALDPHRIHVVHGHGGAQVREALADLEVTWVEQAEQLGTGHAVAQAMPGVDGESRVMVLYGDVPLTRPATLRRLAAAAAAGVGLVTVTLADPDGYGRIVRAEDGTVRRIVEQKDADAAERALCEVNTGLLSVDADRLRPWLARLDNRNAQSEYYLTDIFAMAAEDGVAIHTVTPQAVEEVLGVNDRTQLAHLERFLQRVYAEALMRAGVTLFDPARFDQRGTVEAGRDVVIDANVVLEGRVILGDRVRIGANCVLRDVTLGDDVQIHPMSHLEGADVAAGAQIGPFARLRPEACVGPEARVGNFVEVKKATIGHGSKVNHLSYVGDATVGEGVNIGAGTITCNYDGANKHQTVIGDGAFIGSDTQLVAPVRIGAGATIGAGSTITQDAPAEQLTLSRTKQRSIAGWRRPVKKPKS